MSTDADPSVSTLTGSQLEMLTGLTERRLRQLAKAGYFPPPAKGKFQQTATIRGLFKYYREDHHNTNRTLNEAKLEKLKADAEMSRIKVAQARRQMIDRDEVGDYLNAWVAKLDMLHVAVFINNGPNRVVGLPIDQTRVEMSKMVNDIRDGTARGLRAYDSDYAVLTDEMIDSRPDNEVS